MDHLKITRATGIGIVVTMAFIVFSSYAVATYPNLNLFFADAQVLSQLGRSGTLSVSIADAPDAPSNVTHVYINYTSILVHDIVFASTETGWHPVGNSGTIDLMSVMTESKMLGSVSIPAGTINIIRFDVTSAIVTVHSSTNDRNFSAEVLGGMIQVNIVGGITVRSGLATNILIDITPKVIQTGTGTFKVVPAAEARLSSETTSTINTTTTNTHSTTKSSSGNTPPTTTAASPSQTTHPTSNNNQGTSNTRPTTSQPSTTTSSTTPLLSLLAAGAFPVGLGLLIVAAAALATVMLLRRKKRGSGATPQQPTSIPPVDSGT